ncbi:ABC transporter ATP-binding protein [Oricola sp.]|uniref:dipeptide ABC transporter ATP-binding protein n=1 Tax=Oricola sp. TaxID=1979950 RepID=UPI0025D3389E|nr:ABC transporter ATP-binding protein [Oricola sp.]MCI5075242.1 ABC transporter ATP-binding protein [Oricola sp.]
MSALLDIRDFKVSLGRHTLIGGVDLQVQPGEVVVVVGRSGSGKSLTASAVIDLLPKMLTPSGEVVFDGRDVTRLSRKEIRSLRGGDIGFVFQEPLSALNPLMTIGRQIAEGISYHRSPGAAQMKQEVADLLAQVGLAQQGVRADSYPHELSGGQRQRVVIAMAIANRPKLIIADEPTSALDVTIQKEIVSLLMTLTREYGVAMLFITHDIGLAAEIADRIIVMRDGEIVESGARAQVIENPTHAYSRALIERSTSLARFRAVAEETDAPRKTTVRLTGFSHVYGGRRAGDREVRAVDDVSFETSEGRILGVVGESGSGKSTLARALVKLQKPQYGTIEIFGRDVATLGRRERDRLRPRVQYVFQDPGASLNPRWRIRDIVAESLYAIRRELGPDEVASRVTEALAATGLDAAMADRYPHQLSGGQRQRVAIARAIAPKPDLLIADEAVSALDTETRDGVLEVFLKLRRENACSIVFITHDLSLAKYVCDDVIVMTAGKIVERGTTVDVFRAPKHDYTRALIGAVPKMYRLQDDDDAG